MQNCQEHKIPYIYSFMMIANVIIVSGIQVFSIVNTAPFKSLIHRLFTEFQTTFIQLNHADWK